MAQQEQPSSSSIDSQPSGFKSFTLTVQKRTTIEVTALPIDQHDSDNEEDGDGSDEPQAKRSKVTHFEDGVMVTDEVKPKSKGPLIIDRVVSKDWRLKQLQEKEENGTITEDEKARLAIMLEANGEATDGTKTEKITIDSSDVVPEDADYSQVKIEDFGMAVLRGFGFKEGEGIGRTNKKVVNVTTPGRRVKNLGLGATIASEEDLKDLKKSV